MQVPVYIARDDPDCAATMREMTIGHVWLRPIDITSDEHAEAILRARLGHDGTLPFVVVHAGMRILDHWNGYQPDRLARLRTDYWGADSQWPEAPEPKQGTRPLAP